MTIEEERHIAASQMQIDMIAGLEELLVLARQDKLHAPGAVLDGRRRS